MSEAIFGSFDGVVSVIGVIVALLGHPDNIIISASVGLAAASAVGMAAGQYLGDVNRNIRKALVMGFATIVGTMLPVVPFLVTDGRDACIACALVVVALTGMIAWQRARRGGGKPYLETFGVLVVAALVTAFASWATGSAG